MTAAATLRSACHAKIERVQVYADEPDRPVSRANRRRRRQRRQMRLWSRENDGHGSRLIRRMWAMIQGQIYRLILPIRTLGKWLNLTYYFILLWVNKISPNNHSGNSVKQQSVKSDEKTTKQVSRKTRSNNLSSRKLLEIGITIWCWPTTHKRTYFAQNTICK